MFFGDPAVRLNQVITAAANHKVSSICDGDYRTTLQDMARLIIAQLGSRCLSKKLPGNAASADCTVEEVTHNLDGTDDAKVLPRCAASDGGMVFPCWRIETKDRCAGISPQGLGVTIDRSGAATPPRTTERASCETL